MNKTRLSGKHALITGGAQGMGAAIGEYYAAQGAKVCLADVNLTGCQEVAERINSAGGEAIAVQLDVTNRDQMKAAVAATGVVQIARQTFASFTSPPTVLLARSASITRMSPVPRNAVGALGDTAQQVKMAGGFSALTSSPIAAGTSQEIIRPEPSQQTSSPFAALTAMPEM